MHIIYSFSLKKKQKKLLIALKGSSFVKVLPEGHQIKKP